jgi:hypothetical protein
MVIQSDISWGFKPSGKPLEFANWSSRTVQRHSSMIYRTWTVGDFPVRKLQWFGLVGKILTGTPHQMAIEIVDVPMKNGDFPWFFVCLPEGNGNIYGFRFRFSRLNPSIENCYVVFVSLLEGTTKFAS